MKKPAEALASTLQEHMIGTYLNLRVGIGIIGAALPAVLWLGGWLLDHEALRSSMSAYYYSPTMRDKFVGALVAIGVFLYLYKGFSTRENWALNLAGALAVGVALVPTSPPQDALTHSAGAAVTAHGIFGVLFFLCIAYVCVFRASDTLSLFKDPREARGFATAYRSLGLGMFVSPFVAVVLSFFLEPGAHARTFQFFAEALSVWIFATYWLLKSAELKATGAERVALEGKLQARSSPEVPGSTPGLLVRTEP